MNAIKTTLKAINQLVSMGHAIDLTWADKLPDENINIIAYAMSSYGWVNGVIGKGATSGKTYACTRSSNLFSVMGC